MDYWGLWCIGMFFTGAMLGAIQEREDEKHKLPRLEQFMKMLLWPWTLGEFMGTWYYCEFLHDEETDEETKV